MSLSVQIVQSAFRKNLPDLLSLLAGALSSLSPAKGFHTRIGSAVLTQQVDGRWRVELLHGPIRWTSRRGFPLRGATLSVLA